MSKGYHWIDDAWWRDWVFWVAVVVATTNLVAGIVRTDDALWWIAFRWLYSFGFTVALLGFFRTVGRTYREPSSE